MLISCNPCADFGSSHQNIKPSKVLVMSYGAESPSDWKFKMADFGQSQVKSKIPGEEVTKMENDKTNAMYSMRFRAQ